MQIRSALFGRTWPTACLSALVALSFCGSARAAAITAEVSTGTNASLKITDISSGSNSGSAVPGQLFWYVQIGEADTLDSVRGNAINLWGAQSSSGSLAMGVYFGVFAGFVTPTGVTVPSPYTPLASIEFQVDQCPIVNGSYSCNQYAGKPVLDNLNLGFAMGNNAGQFTIAVYSETPAGTGGNGNVWKTSTPGALTLTDPNGQLPCIGLSCEPGPVEPTLPEELPLPGSAALVLLGLLGLRASRRRAVTI